LTSRQTDGYYDADASRECVHGISCDQGLLIVAVLEAASLRPMRESR